MEQLNPHILFKMIQNINMEVSLTSNFNLQKMGEMVVVDGTSLVT